MKWTILFSIILSLSASHCIAQHSLLSDGTSVNEEAMKQVVKRILVWHFKPQRRRKVIQLAEQGIQTSWLPAIKNIEFQLVSGEAIERDDSKIYFFTGLKKEGEKYQIGFAYGQLHCDYLGSSWYFRTSSEKVKVWQSGGFGCTMYS